MALLPKLASTPATGIIPALQGVKGEFTAAQGADVASAKTAFPTVPQPVGLNAAEDAAGTATPITPATKAVPPLTIAPSPVDAYASAPPVRTASPNVVDLDGEGTVDISAGNREVVLLDGETDPSKLNTAVVESRNTVLPNYQTAQTETAADFGETAVYPDPITATVEGTAEFTELAALEVPAVAATPESETLAPFVDEELKARFATELQASQAAEAVYNDDLAAQELAAETSVTTLTTDLKAKQQAEKDTMIATVGEHRQAWADENHVNLEDFDSSALAEKAAVDGQVKAELDRANGEISTEYVNAESEVAREHGSRNSQQPPATQRSVSNAPIQRKWRPGKLIKKAVDWVDDKIIDPAVNFFKDLWNGFKDFVSGVWNKLKEKVKGIIDRAKAAIKGFIDGIKARLDAVVARIRDAFDAIRDKFVALINTVVSAIAETFKTLIEAAKTAIKNALDAVASAIVAAAKKFADAVVTAIKKIAEAVVEILLMAAEAALRFILKSLGVPNADEVVDSLKAVVKAIMSDPLGFAKNLIDTVTGTFKNYFANIGENLQSVLTTWFFGDPTLELPKDFSSASWIEFGIQASGISGDNIGAMVGAELALPGGITLDLASPIHSLVTGGPDAMWANFKEQLDAFPFVEVAGAETGEAQGENADGTETPSGEGVENEKDAKLQLTNLTWESFIAEAGQFLPGGSVEKLNQAASIYQQLMAGEMSALANDLMAELGDQMSNVPAMMKDMALEWVKNDLLTQLPLLVASFTNPAGGVAKAILAIYKGIMWCIENRAQIAQLIGTIFSILPAIAAGDTAAAQELLTAGINQSIGMLLDLLTTTILNTSAAKQMGKMVDKLTEKVKAAFQSIMKSIQRAIQKFMEAIQKMLGKKKNDVKREKAKKRAEEKARQEREAQEKAEREAAEKREKEEGEEEENEAPREKDYKGDWIPDEEKIAGEIRKLKRKIDGEEPFDDRFNGYGASYAQQVKTYRVLQGLLDAHMGVNPFEKAEGLKKEDADRVAAQVYARHNRDKQLFKFFRVIDADNAKSNDFNIPEGEKYWAFSFSASPTEESAIGKQSGAQKRPAENSTDEPDAKAPKTSKLPSKSAYEKDILPKLKAAVSKLTTGSGKMEQKWTAHQAPINVGTNQSPQPARKMQAHENMVRHLGTVLLALDPSQVEVQVALSNLKKEMFWASNEVGKLKIKDSLSNGPVTNFINAVEALVQKTPFSDDSRAARHLAQLKSTDKANYQDFSISRVNSGKAKQHAETKIVNEIGDSDLDWIGGSRRPCVSCFIYMILRGVDPGKFNQHHGSHWDANAAVLSFAEHIWSDLFEKEWNKGEYAFDSKKDLGTVNTKIVNSLDWDKAEKALTENFYVNESALNNGEPSRKDSLAYDTDSDNEDVAYAAVSNSGMDTTTPAELDYIGNPIPLEAEIGGQISKLANSIHGLDPINTQLPNYGTTYEGKTKTYKVYQGILHAYRQANGLKENGEVTKEALDGVASQIKSKHSVFTAFEVVDASQAKNKSFDSAQVLDHWAWQWSASPWFAAIVGKKKKDQASTQPPQSLFIKQGTTGDLKAFCGYYALSHHKNSRLDIDAFRDQVYAQYREIGLPDEEIPQMILSYGTGMEGLATKQYGYSETKSVEAAASKGRFMAATHRYGGHWLTYIAAPDGNWWEYDSCKAAPSLVGDIQALKATLQKDTMTAMYYGGSGSPKATSSSTEKSASPTEKSANAEKTTEQSGAKSEEIGSPVEFDFEGKKIPAEADISAAIAKLKGSIHALDPVTTKLPDYGSTYENKVKTYKVYQGVLHAYQMAGGLKKNGEVTKEALQGVVGKIKSKHSVFTAFEVVDAGQAKNKSFDTSQVQDHWAWQWSASPWYAAIVGKKASGIFEGIHESNLAPTTPGLSSAAGFLPGESHHKQNIKDVHGNLGNMNGNLQNGKWENREGNLNNAMEQGMPGDSTIDTKVRNDVYVAGIMKDQKMMREAAQFALEMSALYKPGGARAPQIKGNSGEMSHLWPDQDTSGTKNTSYRGWPSVFNSLISGIAPTGRDPEYLSKAMATNEPKLRQLVAKRQDYTLDESMYILRVMGQLRDVMKSEKKSGGVIKEMLEQEGGDQETFNRIRVSGEGTGENRDVPEEHKSSRDFSSRFFQPYGTLKHKDDEIYMVEDSERREPKRFDYLQGTSGTTVDMVNFFLAQGKDKDEATRLTQVFYANWHAVAPDGNAHGQSESIGTMLQYLHRTNLKKPITAPIRGSEDVEGMKNAGYANDLTPEHPGYLYKDTKKKDSKKKKKQ